MAFRDANRVKEITSTTGTGTLSLGGTEAGFQTFIAGIGTGNNCYYFITDDPDWEVGVGTVTSGTPDTLSRDLVLASTNAGAKVNLKSGNKDIVCTLPAEAVGNLVQDIVSVSSATTVSNQANGTYFRADATSAAFTITLPAGSQIVDGFSLVIEKTDSSANAVTVDGNGSENIDGATNRTLAAKDDLEIYVWGGTEWHVLLPALGTAAAKDTGTGNGDVVALEDVGGGTIGLPAVDGSQLTGLATITLGTPVAATSGTYIDFTGIPAGTKRIKVLLYSVSTTGTSPFLVQLGDSGGIETTGYVGLGTGGGGYTANTNGFLVMRSVAAASAHQGVVELNLIQEISTTFRWAESGQVGTTNGVIYITESVGVKSLSAELDRVRLTTIGGTDTFDTGTVNIQYEG